MRRPVFTGSFAFPGELVVDSFAGGGGASTGIEQALNRPVDIAINHDAEAIAMHRANHPDTKHFCEDIYAVEPVAACAGRPVGLAWFSPACNHFSKAKGTAPVTNEIRGLAWVVINWAKAVKPRVIILENVQEFETWGPLIGDRPDKSRAGETFREWLAQLRGLGYSVEFTTMVAADYGAPTTRKRLYMVARRDSAGIAWPTATHGQGRPNTWRTAAEIIDWSLPCPSIFERKRPLVEATMRRIARGIQRFVIDADNPFIIPVTHQGDERSHSLDEPLRTVTAAHRGEMAFVSPFVVRHGHYSTITGAGLREGCGAGTFRGQQLGAPLATVCATNDKHLVMPFIAAHYGGNGTAGRDAREPLRTVTGVDHNALVAPFLTKHGVRATAGNHAAETRAFIMKYYKGDGAPNQQQDLFSPLHTVTTKARFGLVTIAGQAYQIADIGMRMLSAAELFAAQGFPGDYEIAPDFKGKPLTKSAQISCAGNSVCPPVAQAIVAANSRAA